MYLVSNFRCKLLKFLPSHIDFWTLDIVSLAIVYIKGIKYFKSYTIKKNVILNFKENWTERKTCKAISFS